MVNEPKGKALDVAICAAIESSAAKLDGLCDAIRDHVANARFSSDELPLNKWQRVNVSRFAGKPHPSNPSITLTEETILTSAEFHILKRIEEGHWKPGTSTSEYLDDVRAAAAASSGPVELGKGPAGQRVASRVGLQTTEVNARSSLAKAVVNSGHVFFTLYDPVRRCLNSCYPLTSVGASLAKWTHRRTIT